MGVKENNLRLKRISSRVKEIEEDIKLVELEIEVARDSLRNGKSASGHLQRRLWPTFHVKLKLESLTGSSGKVATKQDIENAEAQFVSRFCWKQVVTSTWSEIIPGSKSLMTAIRVSHPPPRNSFWKNGEMTKFKAKLRGVPLALCQCWLSL